MYVSSIVDEFNAIVGHKDFPRDIEEMSILLDILKPENDLESLVTGAGVSLDEDGNIVVIDSSELVRLLNNIGGGEFNSDFTPKNELEKKFFDFITKDKFIIKNLKEIELSDLYSEDEITKYNSIPDDYDEWKYYHEGVQNKNTEMDVLTRL